MLANGSIIAGFGVGLNSSVGTVLRIASKDFRSTWTKSNDTIEVELANLRQSISAVAASLQNLAEHSNQSNREILEALQIILEDEELLDEATKNINEGWNAGAAFGKAIDAFSQLISGDDEFAERVADLQDLSKRVQAHLANVSLTLELPSEGQIVLVGDDFAPADTAQFTDAIVGVITLQGGPTSHTSIICRSLGIAALVAAPTAAQLESGQKVLVDPVGNRAIVGGESDLATQAIQYIAISEQPLITVRANVGNLKDAAAAAATSAQGVGLLRTEFLFLNEQSEPSVATQTETYRQVFDAAPAGPIVVRTIDATGDKPIAFISTQARERPTAERGYHLLHLHRDLVQRQLEAIEAARKITGREVWVMAPLIASIDEAKDFCDLAKSIGGFRVGIMIELPSITDHIAELKDIADFVSIGTNDLSQYLFEADRLNSSHAELLSHWQPLLVQTIAKVAAAGAACGIEVGVCGESASDPSFAIVLAGLGVTSLSVAPSQIEAVSTALRSVTLPQAQARHRQTLP